MILETRPPLNWHRFTAAVAGGHGPEIPKRSQLVAKALRSSTWKTSGAIIFLGVIGWNEELWQAGEYVAAVIGRHVDAYDEFHGVPNSFLESDRIATVPHIRTPPTIHPRVRIFNGVPDLTTETRAIIFACIPPGRAAPLVSRPLRRALFEGTVLVGEHEDLRKIARQRRLRYRILGRHRMMLAVRAST